MNIDELSILLKPWMQVKTWDTHHPSDEKRFHDGLKTAIDKYEYKLSSDYIEEAMQLLANDLSYDKRYNKEYLDEAIARYVKKADIITSYEFDTR